MQRCLTALLLTLSLTAAPAALAQQDPLADIDRCTAKLDPDADVGYDRIAARCPELVRRLDESNWAAWLPRDWKTPGNDLSAGGLKELRTLVQRELQTSAPTHAPRVDQLNGVLARFRPAGQQNESLWSRFKSWLRDVLERREQPADDGWLARMVAHIGLSQTVIELISYTALALVVALAGVIIGNELRSAGALRSRGRGGRTGSDSNGRRSRGEPSWNDIEQAPLRERPGMVLDLITERLTQQNRLPPPEGLTVRELTRAVRLPSDADRERFVDVAQAAETARFSDREPAADNIERVLKSGRDLLHRLGKPAGLSAAEATPAPPRSTTGQPG